MVATKQMTADELLTVDGNYELVRGELRKVSPTSPEPSRITVNFIRELSIYVRTHKLGWVTSSEAGFVLFPDRKTVVAPDVGFVRKERIPKDLDQEHFFPFPPDLAVEVVSPSDRYSAVSEKVDLYIEAGVPLVWVAVPRRKVVIVHRPGQAPRTLTLTDELDGEDVVPGFRLAVSEIFEDPLAD